MSTGFSGKARARVSASCDRDWTQSASTRISRCSITRDDASTVCPYSPRPARFSVAYGADVPDYVSAPESYSDATERIAEFWRRRWLSNRLAHAPSWTTLGETRSWLLSSAMPLREPPPEASNGGTADTGGAPDEYTHFGDGDGPTKGSRAERGGGQNDEDRLAFWRRLARAGYNAVSEGLTRYRVQSSTPKDAA